MYLNVKVQVYIDIYVCVSRGDHNLSMFCARKFKFGMLLTQT